MSLSGIDFEAQIEKMKKRQEAARAEMQIQFNMEEPGEPEMAAICNNCANRFGEHYGTISHLYCPNEWVAAGHKLA